MRGVFINNGIFRKTTLGILSVPISFSNTGTVKGLGSLLYSGGITNDGKVAPGLSPGILTIDGDFTNGTVLDIELKDGTGVGTGHDQLIVTGMATLSDTLKVTETGTVPNGSYTILKCEGASPCISGSFDVLELPPGYSVLISATEVSVSRSVLPVELQFFKARQFDQKVLLEWTTVSETNNAFFAIERSVDGRLFETIGTIAGHGNYLVIQQYQWIDEPWVSTGEILYYRLRQVDFDGTEAFSDLETIHWKGDKGPIEITNVFSRGAQLEVHLSGNNNSGTHFISLFDLSGKMLINQILPIGFNRTLIDLPKIPSGIYLVALSNEKIRTVKRIRIVRE